MVPARAASAALTRSSSGDMSRPVMRVGWYLAGPYVDSGQIGRSFSRSRVIDSKLNSVGGGSLDIEGLGQTRIERG